MCLKLTSTVYAVTLQCCQQEAKLKFHYFILLHIFMVTHIAIVQILSLKQQILPNLWICLVCIRIYVHTDTFLFLVFMIICHQNIHISKQQVHCIDFIRSENVIYIASITAVASSHAPVPVFLYSLLVLQSRAALKL